MRRSFISREQSDNPQIAAEILTVCSNKRIFAFFGQLGSGKTTLIREFCHFLGVKEGVSSPTFTLINEYDGKGETLFHFDLYRLRSESEAYDIGIEEYLESGLYCFIEWPENIPSMIQDSWVKIYITLGEETERKIEVIYGEGTALN